MTMILHRLLVTAAVAGALALPAAAQPAPETPGPSEAAPPPASAPAEAPAATLAAPPASVSPAPPTVSEAPAGRVAAPPAGKGQVVFYRPQRIGGMVVSFSIKENGAVIGKLSNGSYLVLAADPGPHAYTTESEAKDTLNMEVETGETYYVEQTIGVGIMMARPHLAPASQQTFDKLSAKSMKPIVIKTSDAKPVAND